MATTNETVINMRMSHKFQCFAGDNPHIMIYADGIEVGLIYGQFTYKQALAIRKGIKKGLTPKVGHHG